MLAENSSPPVTSVPPRRRSAPPRPPPLPRPSSGSPSPTGPAASFPHPVLSTVKNGTPPPPPPPPRPPLMALKTPLSSPQEPPDKNVNKPKESSSQDPSGQYIQAIDPKKSQSLAILIKAHNYTTEEARDALQEGYEFPSEIGRALLNMAPTSDEEQRLRLFGGDLSRLGFAERFLKDLLDIPFAFKRLECSLFICTFEEEASMVKECFATLESACTELQKSRLFLNHLEAFLETGGHMNDGTFHGGEQQAFKLDTLLKLYDVKEKDGKTTLLHVAVQEIIRSEGIRAAHAAGASQSMSSINSDDLLNESSPDTEEHYRSIGLQKVSGLIKELENVKRAAAIDTYILTGTFAELVHGLSKARDFLNSEMKNVDEENGFYQMLNDFVQSAEVDVTWLLGEEKRIKALVKSTGDYFHGNSAEDEGLRLFVIVRDFLIILDKVCKEMKMTSRIPNKTAKKKEDGTTAAL